MFTRRQLLLILLLLVSLANAPLAAEDLERDYVVRTWTSRDGLPLDTVRALAQTPDGFLWVATFNGLARFDGSRFVVFQMNNTPELADDLINALFCDGQGRLWIGHDTGKVTVRSGHSFSRVKLPADWSSQPIHRFGDDAQGNVWVLNSQWRLACIQSNGVVRLFNLEAHILNLDSTAADGVLRATTIDGRCYCVRPDGLTPDPDQPPLPNSGKHLLRSRAGGYWSIYGEHLQRWMAGASAADFGPVQWGDSIYVSMAEWRNWVVGGSFTKGLFFAGGQGSRARLTAAEGLPDNSITALLVDRDQTLWAGTRGGLAALWPKRVRVIETPSGNFGQRIQSVVPAGTNGIWAATEAGGLFRYDGQWTRANLQGGRSQVLTALWSSPNRDLWVGSGGGGLMRLAASEWENGSWRVAETGLPNNEFVHCLLQTTPGQLWVGTSSGLFLLSGDGSEKAVPLTLPGVINCLAEDGSGGVWFGTKGAGLGHWRSGRITYLREADGLPSENIFALYRDPGTSGTLWVGTAGAGLVRYQGGRLSVISSRNGLPDDAICQIIADDAGRFWLGTYAGICAVKLADLNACADGRLARLDCLMLNEADGLTTPECSSAQQPACCRTHDGRLWFGTRQGVAVVNPAHIAINTNPAQIWIEPLRTDTGVVAVAEASGKVALPLGQRRVEFRFAAPSLKSENRVSFIHRLAPVETEWSQPDRSHDVIYGALPPGDYTFHVRAANEDGVWSSTDATMAFYLPPHLWERVWFAPAVWTGGALAVCGLVLLDLRRRARRRLERSERQRALERERARISKDLHDDLGGSLTEVGILASAAAEGQASPELRGYLDEINRKSEGMIYALDEIIWAINPRHDSVRSFAEYLSGHATEFLSRAGLRLRLDVQQDLPEIQFDSRRRHSFFLAAKEALTNVVRHAAAVEVLLHLRIHEGWLRVTIEDNGSGFDPTAAAGRHGLQNLHERLEEMGGRCRITRGVPTGTRVELEVPL